MDIAAIISLLSAVATPVGVLIAAWQLHLSHKQSVTSFEDDFAREYRELAARLPTRAFLAQELTDEEYLRSFDEFYHYFDLCNEQIFLYRRRRVTPATWMFWFDGMKSNMKRPAFRQAWSEIAAYAGADFSELRDLFPPEEYIPTTRVNEQYKVQAVKSEASVIVQTSKSRL